MKKVLIVYHSQSGNTARLARVFLKALAKDKTLSLRFLKADAATFDDMVWCDLIVFGAAEYLGTLSGMMKDFFDRTFHSAKSNQQHKPYGVFISAGNNGSRAVAEIDRIVKHYPFYKISEPLIINGNASNNGLLTIENYAVKLIASS